MSIKDGLFMTDEGRYVYGQKPNTPMLMFIVFFTAKTALNSFGLIEDIQPFLQASGVGALIWWALLEIFKGSNLFRKLLGWSVMLGLLVTGIINTTG